ncbi:Asp23/Gls24 family envelope stress response protein [Streptomyces zagrosensis]|uniref:Asp23/Gls24 family envelope stress response protein n=1 Tax=Streptomyces zagrosensis TaxID=1042984 RepID=A0A7W9QBY3_9ACTN|nr:Asp23/Gls24 family envelope stress response protein [Streptomyces zagrosensis]MBB5937354.1 hypothetical protein [Streptomyces zagrosensis]
MAVGMNPGSPGDGPDRDDETPHTNHTPDPQDTPHTRPGGQHADHAGHEGDEILLCGRSLALVWEAEEPDEHTAACPYCRQALAGLGVLDRYVREARIEPEPPAEAITARVMDLVRTELRPGRMLPLGEPADDAWIAEVAAAKVFRETAESLPGVFAGSCKVMPIDPAAARRSLLPGGQDHRGPMRVSLELTATLDWTVPELAALVRQLVADAAREAVGMDVAEIDVSVVDVIGDGLGDALGDEPPLSRDTRERRDR